MKPTSLPVLIGGGFTLIYSRLEKSIRPDSPSWITVRVNDATFFFVSPIKPYQSQPNLDELNNG